MKADLPELTTPWTRQHKRLTQTDLHQIGYYEELANASKQRLKMLRAQPKPDDEETAAEESILWNARMEFSRLERKFGPWL